MHNSNEKNPTSLRLTLIAIFAALVIAGCGAKSSDKANDGVTPSPTGETVINGRA